MRNSYLDRNTVSGWKARVSRESCHAEVRVAAAQHGPASRWSGASGSAARSPLSVDLPQASSAMCGYRGKRRACSLTGGVDSLLDVRGESVVSLPSLPSGVLQGDGAEGVLVAGGVTAHRGRDVHVSLCRRRPSFRVHLSCRLRCAARNDIFPCAVLDLCHLLCRCSSTVWAVMEIFSRIRAHFVFCGHAASGLPGVEPHEVIRFAVLAGVPCPSDSAPEFICF